MKEKAKSGFVLRRRFLILLVGIGDPQTVEAEMGFSDDGDAHSSIDLPVSPDQPNSLEATGTVVLAYHFFIMSAQLSPAIESNESISGFYSDPERSRK